MALRRSISTEPTDPTAEKAKPLAKVPRRRLQTHKEGAAPKKGRRRKVETPPRAYPK